MDVKVVTRVGNQIGHDYVWINGLGALLGGDGEIGYVEDAEGHELGAADGHVDDEAEVQGIETVE